MKKLLVLNFFPANFPPKTGGELRYFHIYEEMSKYYDVTLFSSTFPQRSVKIKEHSKTFREYLVPNEVDIHGRINKELKGRVGIEYSALVSALGSFYPNKHHEVFIKLYENSDIIIHESPFMLGYDLFWGLDDKPRIYNSYNNEVELVKQMWDGEDREKYIKYFTKLEAKMVKQADLVFAVSEKDRKSFIEDYMVHKDKVKLAPNGVHPKQWKLSQTKKNNNDHIKALFIGSKHPPNHKAVEFIIKTLAPQCKNIEFIIAGDCCTPFKAVKNTNVKLLGRVDNKKKFELFTEADVALNPMFTGGGTNLKTLEYLSAGIPLFSTDTGVRGLGLTDGKHYFKVGAQDFASKLQKMVIDYPGLSSVSLEGKSYIDQHYSWKRIVSNMKMELEKLSLKVKPKTLLILNETKVSNESAEKKARIYHLYGKISKFYNIILISLNNLDVIEVNHKNNHFVELSFPYKLDQIIEYTSEKKQYKKMNERKSTMINNEFFIRKFFKQINHLINASILLNPFMVSLLQTNKKPVVYDFYSRDSEQKDLLKKKISFYEKAAFEKSNLIVSKSQKEQKLLRSYDPEMKKNMLIIPNGTNLIKDDLSEADIKEIKKIFQGKPIILFYGNADKQDTLSLHFIMEELAPIMENCYFIIIGSVCRNSKENIPKNILLFESVEESYKNVLTKISNIAINPALESSGFNLQIPEYLIQKIPTITTPSGCTGFDIIHEQHALISDLQNFNSQMKRLINDKSLQNKLIKQSSQLINEELNWDKYVKLYQLALDNLLKQE